ncbi:hypothetical protein PtrSN002B_011192 [Pyrenophora tritici-repentis]|uniref:Uncharacterized protein n=2 Tax=Pyrenophora tritici-repentis TaxID=45151 RepID=A0A2W1HID0_9PLEO|nr:uncharacterized protein PTRG_01160 [Pyrenophora tritici-repentis Pt-1C-BFP]KAA8625792.1 hypothetical protein PtrV1_01472 [Pyrenophora tritici-repentis]EDU40598.1 predicted protein [Pyrenophora tritici-repentis Pt-1C-BFP]KAF7454209.1 hypothetical protein A1F99_014670 [Pyrenophora tritici-repentis]KAF7577301.1 hypothetical protein PtrM4_015410 [Pyrenophora tritici-repentis]KAG9387957.1 hypothetical protein A1F94_000849 [Pyrenophora tritici-repentis]
MASSRVPRRRDRYNAPRDASQSSTSSDGIKFDNIIVPDHEVQVNGVIRRSQYQPARVTGPIPQAMVIAARSNQDEGNKEIQSEKNEGVKEIKSNRQALASAGPDALQSLRKEFQQTMLAQLPDWKTLEISTHSKPATGGYARLCIEIGKYGQTDMKKWRNSVLAYLTPNLNPNIGPNLSMEVKKTRDRGHDLVEVTWKDDIALGRVDLVQPFNQASSAMELYALVKYYYLLANEAKHQGLTHDFIPINRTFIDKLKAVCNRYDPDYCSVASSENDFYTDKDKSPKLYPRAPDHRRQAGYAHRPGVATTKSHPGIDDTDDIVDDHDRDPISQSSLESGEILEDLSDNSIRRGRHRVDARTSKTPKSQQWLQRRAIEDEMKEDKDIDVRSRDNQARHFRSMYEVEVEENADDRGKMQKGKNPAKHVSFFFERRQPTDRPVSNSGAYDVDNLPESGRKSDTGRTATKVSKTQMVKDNLELETGITRPPSQSRHGALRPSSSAFSLRSRDMQRRREREDKRTPTDPNPMNKHRTTSNSADLPAEKISKAGHKTLSGRVEKKPGIKQKIKHVQELGVTQANILKEMMADHEKAMAKHEKMKAEHEMMAQRINRKLKEIVDMISDEPEEEEEKQGNPYLGGY